MIIENILFSKNKGKMPKKIISLKNSSHVLSIGQMLPSKETRGVHAPLCTWESCNVTFYLLHPFSTI